MATYLPLILAAAAIGLTYLFCVRPMRHGSCHGPANRPGVPAALATELEIARTELELLHLQQARRAGATSSHTTAG